MRRTGGFGRVEKVPETLGACPWKKLRTTRWACVVPFTRLLIPVAIHSPEQTQHSVLPAFSGISTVFTASIDTARDLI